MAKLQLVHVLWTAMQIVNDQPSRNFATMKLTWTPVNTSTTAQLMGYCLWKGREWVVEQQQWLADKSSWRHLQLPACEDSKTCPLVWEAHRHTNQLLRHSSMNHICGVHWFFSLWTLWTLWPLIKWWKEDWWLGRQVPTRRHKPLYGATWSKGWACLLACLANYHDHQDLARYWHNGYLGGYLSADRVPSVHPVTGSRTGCLYLVLGADRVPDCRQSKQLKPLLSPEPRLN